MKEKSLAERVSEHGGTQRGHGIYELGLGSWNELLAFLPTLAKDDLIFRGQRDSRWKLISRFDRKAQSVGRRYPGAHLENFKSAILGRRGANPPTLKTENDWWGLGQHYGLATPLLDWTSSPYIAAYFAFAKERQNHNRAIWGLNRRSVMALSDLSMVDGALDFIMPRSDENARILSQSGLFTLVKNGEDIEAWLEKRADAESIDLNLLKITLPNDIRLEVLRNLRQMNITHGTLFPDIYGAAMLANMKYKMDDLEAEYGPAGQARKEMKEALNSLEGKWIDSLKG